MKHKISSLILIILSILLLVRFEVAYFGYSRWYAFVHGYKEWIPATLVWGFTFFYICHNLTRK